MVAPVSLYVLAGSDVSAKDAALKKIKDTCLSGALLDFNLDTVYARDIDCKKLQERFCALPVSGARRLVIIRDAQSLKAPCRDFLLDYCRAPYPGLTVVLDMDAVDQRDVFFSKISALGVTQQFGRQERVDAFVLTRHIDSGNAQPALVILHRLFAQGTKAELILGGMRASFERSSRTPADLKKKLSLLLVCDSDIKTGRLKPEFAMERLVVRLCGLGKTGA